MSHSRLTICLLLSVSLWTTRSSSAAIVYDTLSTNPTIGFSEPNSDNLILGDSLTLTQPGTLTNFGVSIFNPHAGNTGSIQTGTMLVTFYDNTVPYSAGALAASDPVLGSVTLTWDFTPIGGLTPGSFQTGTFDLSQFAINLPQNILVTQQFTETSGDSTGNGAVLYSDPAIGSSPNSVYLNSTGNPEGLYAIPGDNPGQFGYSIEVTPEPNLALAALLLFPTILPRRRRASSLP